jgi:hypothetical protein
MFPSPCHFPCSLSLEPRTRSLESSTSTVARVCSSTPRPRLSHPCGAVRMPVLLRLRSTCPPSARRVCACTFHHNAVHQNAFVAATVEGLNQADGLGNDFVIIDSRSKAVKLDADLCRRISNRRTGVGCDQVCLASIQTL